MSYKLSAMERDKLIIEGWLYKRTNYLGYQKRWFVITSDSMLLYYKSQKDRNNNAYKAKIELNDICIAQHGDDLHFALKTKSGVEYHLKASSAVEGQRWIAALQQAKGHPSEAGDTTEAQEQISCVATDDGKCTVLVKEKVDSFTSLDVHVDDEHLHLETAAPSNSPSSTPDPEEKIKEQSLFGEEFDEEHLHLGSAAPHDSPTSTPDPEEKIKEQSVSTTFPMDGQFGNTAMLPQSNCLLHAGKRFETPKLRLPPIQEAKDGNRDKPQIRNIVWHSNAVTVEWVPANNASKHILKIIGKDGRVDDIDPRTEVLYTSLAGNRQFFSVKIDSRFRYGENCKFVIEATKKDGGKETCKKKVVLGGASVVTNVVVNQKDGRRLMVTWSSPEITLAPTGYKLSLLKLLRNNRNQVAAEYPVVLTSTSHTFMELQSNSYYCCRVSPIYAGCPSNGTFSNIIKTNPRVNSHCNTTETFGELKISHITSYADPCNVTLSWTRAQLGDNFRINSYRVSVQKVGCVGDEILLQKELSALCTEVCLTGVEVSNTYVSEVIVSYVDLDTLELNKIATEYKFFIPPVPKKVSGLCLLPTKDPSISMRIGWDESMEVEETLYRVCVSDCDKIRVQTVNTTSKVLTLQELEPGTVYVAWVAAGNSFGFGMDSEELTFHTTLAAPRNVSLTRMDDSPCNSLVLKFSEAGAGVDHYTAMLMKGIDSLQEVMPPAAVSSGHIYTNLEPNTAYIAKVQSKSTTSSINGEHVISKPVYTAPAKVQNVIVERCDITGSLVKATWNAAYSCQTYEVQITRNKIKEAVLRVDQPLCLHSCLGPGVTYRIQVRAHENEVYGQWSEEVAITLVPGPVHIKSAKPVDRGIEVRWKGPTQDKHDHQYSISLFTKTGMLRQEKVSSEITNHRFQDLLPGKQYFCSVSAENEAGCGLAEKSDWIKLPWIRPENFVVRLKPEDPSHKALFTWDHPDGVDCFKLVIDGPEFQRCFEIEQNEFLFTNGSPGTTYNCRLHNGCDGIYDPDAVTLAQPLVMAPDPPTNVRVTLDKDPNKLKIQFDEPAVQPDRYEISVLDVDDNIAHCGVYIPPYCQFTELQLGRKYKLLIQSVNGDNLGSRKISSDIFETYPPKVQKLVLSSCCNESALVKWICPSRNVKSFTIRYKYGSKHFEQSTTEREFKMTGLKRSRVYHVTVAAENSAGRGEFSTFLEFQTALANLTHVKIHKSEHQPSRSLIVEIKDRDRKSKAYVITARAKSDGTAAIQRTQQMTCAVTGLRPGETYDVFVRAESGNKVSETAYAPEPSMTVPDKVKGVQAESVGEEQNIVRWPKLPFPCSYRLRWKSATEENYLNEEVGPMLL